MWCGLLESGFRRQRSQFSRFKEIFDCLHLRLRSLAFYKLRVVST